MLAPHRKVIERGGDGANLLSRMLPFNPNDETMAASKKNKSG
jgi:hypothetical protein